MGHGEKLLSTNSESVYQMNNYGITNLEMEKQRLLDLDLETLQLICVNPYDVNPVTHPNTTSHQISTEAQQSEVKYKYLYLTYICCKFIY